MRMLRQSVECFDDLALMDAEKDFTHHRRWIWENETWLRRAFRGRRGFFAWQQLTRLHKLWSRVIACRRVARDS